MQTNKLPDQFDIPFLFKGDPVMTGFVNGIHFERCVLDTGAPTIVMRLSDPSNLKNIQVDKDGFSFLDSLIIHGIEFGPSKVRTRIVKDLSAPEIYIGTSELRSHCLQIDYQNQLIRFTRSKFLSENQKDYSAISFSRGRPIIHLTLGDKIMNFVLDTGSNANWLFNRNLNLDLLNGTQSHDEKINATCGLGDISVRQSLDFFNIKIGGQTANKIRFLCANENDFGGPSATLEDGIIGTGQIATWFNGVQIVDFISNKFYLHLPSQKQSETVRNNKSDTV